MASKKQAVETKQRHRRTDEEMLAEVMQKAAKLQQRIEERKNKVDVPKVGRGFLNILNAATTDQLLALCDMWGITLDQSEGGHAYIKAQIVSTMIFEAENK